MNRFFLSLRYLWLAVLVSLVTLATVSAQAQLADPPPIDPGDPCGLFPNSGSVGDSITYVCVNADVVDLRVNGVSFPFTRKSSLYVVVAIPAGATSGYFQHITSTESGYDSTHYLTIVDAATAGITLDPPDGVAGDSISLKGTGLDSVVMVKLEQIPAAFRIASDSLIRFEVPGGARSGMVRVFYPSGQVGDSAQFTVAGSMDTCNTAQPIVSISSVTLCGPGNMSFRVDSSNGCPVVISIVGNGDRGVIRRIQATAATDSVYTVFMTESGSILVHTECDSACVSDDATITVTVNTTPFDISIADDTGMVGDTIRIAGISLNSVNVVTLSGDTLAFQQVSDSLITAVVPAGAQSGLVRVSTFADVLCPDTASYTVLQVDTCDRTPPTVSVTSLTRCGPGLVEFTASSGNGCQLEWCFDPSDDARSLGGVMPNDSLIQVMVDDDGVIQVWTRCDSTCLSTAVNIDVTLQTSPFNLLADSVAGIVGDTLRLAGAMLDSVDRVTVSGIEAAYIVEGPNDISIIVPTGAQSGMIVLMGNGLCSDSVAFTLGTDSTTCNAPVVDRSDFFSCGPQTFTVNVVDFGGCTLEWFFASAPDSMLQSGTDSAFTFTAMMTDTLMVRSRCDTSCVSGFTMLPIQVDTSSFNISLAMDSAMAGDTIMIMGSGVAGVNQVRLNGTELSIVATTDSTVTVALPDSAMSGMLYVYELTKGTVCPDSVMLTIRDTVAADTCITNPPFILTTVDDNCNGTSSVTSIIASSNGCTPMWYLASMGMATPIATGDTLSITLSAVDTILVRTMCDTGCVSDWTRVGIEVLPRFAFNLPADSASPGDTVFFTVNSRETDLLGVTLAGQTINFAQVSGTGMPMPWFFVVPLNAGSGDLIVRAGLGCSDTVAFTVLRDPVVCAMPPMPSITGLSNCGPATVTVGIDSSNGCGLQWYLASLGTSGSPVSTDTAFSMMFTTSDTILVRTACGTGCVSDFTAIPIFIERSFFNIRLVPDSGMAGDTIEVRGNRLDEAGVTTYAGLPILTEQVSDTLMRFVVPAGAQSGYYTVFSPFNACPDSALFTIRQPVVDCDMMPVPSVTSARLCGPGSVTVRIDSSNGCNLQWYLASSGTAGAPLSTDSLFTMMFTAGDTILVRSYCDSGCSSSFTRIPVTIDTSSFNISLSRDSVLEGETIQVSGTGLSGVQDITLGGNDIPFQLESDSLITIQIPFGANSGWIRVISVAGGTCPDSAFVTVIPPVIDTCSAAPTVSTPLVRLCGPGVATVTATSSNACGLQWFLASQGLTVPVATGPGFTRTFSANDTIFVRSYCDTACFSTFSSVMVMLDSSTFNIRLDQQRLCNNQVNILHGSNLNGVNVLMIDTVSVPVLSQTDSTISFNFPASLLGDTLVSIKVSGPGSCPDSIQVQVSTCLSTKLSLAGGFTIAPNPARYRIWIESDLLKGRTPVTMYDAKGRLVFRRDLTLTKGRNEVSLPSLPPGLYLVRMGGYTAHLMIE